MLRQEFRFPTPSSSSLLLLFICCLDVTKRIMTRALLPTFQTIMLTCFTCVCVCVRTCMHIMLMAYDLYAWSAATVF